jgi:hypothetical protein
MDIASPFEFKKFEKFENTDFCIPLSINTQFIYSNRDVYIAIALCSSLLHSAIDI